VVYNCQTASINLRLSTSFWTFSWPPIGTNTETSSAVVIGNRSWRSQSQDSKYLLFLSCLHRYQLVCFCSCYFQDGTKVYGRCGGFCGKCVPHVTTGLPVQVTWTFRSGKYLQQGRDAMEHANNRCLFLYFSFLRFPCSVYLCFFPPRVLIRDSNHFIF
jgi:hypothetical protein